MGDQAKLALLSDTPTAASVAVKAFAKGGKVPTDAQKEAGNYKMSHIRVHGMDVSIENEKGSERSGTGKDGKPWSVSMPAHYGYIRGTEGADGDHVDIYVGPHPSSPLVFIVDQLDHTTGKFDEHKAMLGFPSKKAALATYVAGFSDGKGHARVGHVTIVPIGKFREWLAKGKRTAPAVKSFEEGGPVEDDWEPIHPDEASKMGLDPNGPAPEARESENDDDEYEPISPEEVEKLKLDPNGPKASSAMGAFGRGLAEGIVPAAAAIPAAGAGAEIGAAAGVLGGPLAPFTVPAGALAGGLAGAYLGAAGAGKVQDWFLDKLGLLDHEQRSADEQAHPYARMAGSLAPNLAAFNPARVGSTLVGRGVPAAIGGGVEAAQEKMAGEDIDPTKVAIAAGGMALMNRPTALGKSLLGAGEAAGRRVTGRAAPATDGQPGRPDLKALPAPPDYTTSPEGETARYPGGDDQVFGDAAAPRPGTAAESERPIYEMNRGEYSEGTAPPDNVAMPVEDAQTPDQSKTPEFVAQSKDEATPQRNMGGTLGTAHEQAPPSKTDATIGSNPEHLLSVGSEQKYAKAGGSAVDPVVNPETAPQAEVLDPAQGNIPQDVAAAIKGEPIQPQQERPPIGPEQPTVPDTGIQEGNVTDTVTKLRDKGLNRVADAVEKNPHVAVQARRILQDLTQEPVSGMPIDADKAQRARRMMERANGNPDIEASAKQLEEEARNPNAKAEREAQEAQLSEQRTAQREAGGQTVEIGGQKVTAASERKASLIKRAADAAQASYEAHPPVPGETNGDYSKLANRLRSAVARATEENLGSSPIKRASAKETPAQKWLRAAQDAVGTPENPKTLLPSRAVKFLGDERLMRGGAAKEVADTNKIEGDVRFNKRRVTMDPAAKAYSDWMDTLSPEDRATLDKDGISEPGVDHSVIEDHGFEPGDFEDQQVGGKRPGLDSYDSMIDTASRMWGDEHGGVKIDKLVAALKGAFGKSAKKTALSYIARTPEGVRQQYARNLSDGLQAVRQAKVEQRVSLLKEGRAMPDWFRTPEVQEQVYLAREAGKTNSLPQKIKDAYDTHLKPIFDRNDQLFANIEKLSPGMFGDKVTDHIYRIAKGLHDEYGSDPVTGEPIRGLSRTASMLKERQFMAIEDAQGNRKVVSPMENGYAEWDKGASTNRNNASFEGKEGSTFTDQNGVQQTVKKALTPEIEAHAKFSNGANAEYYRNGMVSAMETNAYLGDVARNLQYLESVKSDQTFLKYATQDPKIARDNDWKATILPQMQKWYMANQLRYALDDYAKSGFHDEGLDKVRALSQNVTKLLFWMPTAHIGNVGAHWFVARGWNWIKPEGMRNLAVTTMQAYKSVLSQDHIQSEMRALGAGSVYGGVITSDFINQAAKVAGMEMMKNRSKWDPIARHLDISVPEMASAIYKWSSRTMWSANDMMLTQAYLENKARGMSPREAIIRAEQHIPNYRIPTTIMGSGEGARFMSKLMSDPLFMSFGRYHYGVFNSYAHIVKDIAQGTGEERMESIGKLMAMGVLALGVYPVLNQMASAITGNKDATVHPRGPLAIPHHLMRALQGKEDIMQGARSTMTLSPLLATSLETLQNKDWAGRNIVEPGQVRQIAHAPTLHGKLRAGAIAATQEGEHLARGLISPYGTAAQAADAKRSPFATIRDQALDIRNPSPAAVRYENSGPIKNLAAARSRENKGHGPAERIINNLTR